LPNTPVSLPAALCGVVVFFGVGPLVHAQGGPPFLTNDPGTPGPANWEINVGSMQTVARGSASYQVPQVDLNFGLGDTVQLTYEIPFVLDSGSGQPLRGGWGNGFPGIKWRFLDQGQDGWQMSVFPQVQTGVSRSAQDRGIGGEGPRYLLPVEITRKIGPLDVDFEAGYFLPGRGPRERTLGLVAGRSVSDHWEIDAEIYDDRVFEDGPHSTTLDLGGRYKLGRGFVALFMAGRGVDGLSNGGPVFIGYVGLQILLRNYGRNLNSE
jgi:hypothetical protein